MRSLGGREFTHAARQPPRSSFAHMDQLRAVDALGSGWLAALLVLAFGMLAWVNMVSPRQWVVLARSFGALRLGRHRLREELDMRDRTLTGLAVMSTMVIAMFGYQVLLFQELIQPGFLGFLRVLLVVALVIVGPVVLLRTLRLLPAGACGHVSDHVTVSVLHLFR